MIDLADLGESQEVAKILVATSSTSVGMCFFIKLPYPKKAWPISSLNSSAIILNSLAKIEAPLILML